MRAHDARRDLVVKSIDLHTGSLRFVRPRDPAVLLSQEDEVPEAYPPYWAKLWPSGVELAYQVSVHDWSGTSVVELGCGLGLPAVAAALAGGRVLATDRATDALAFTAANARANHAQVQTMLCSWDAPEPLTACGPWQLVLASDVLYEQRNSDALIALLPRLVTDDGAVWIADPGREMVPEFLTATRAAWRTVEVVATRRQDVQMIRLAGPPR
ncbi:class I SAM-dependent methyltransferase [Pseudonocardia lacus]|uniref:class I SAM-dependent methyltransferase n=1 Tax=Pseudonocardia lacus TaxID=2835865 RepID=UPI001BDBEAC6|nr:50S ribosomal protein L11 methyltransferase [Pseudonocardia lacus]